MAKATKTTGTLKESEATTYKISAEEAKLINEGATLSASIKEKELRLSQIKEILKGLPKGTYKTMEGKILNVSLIDQYTPIDPRDVLEVLTKERRAKDFVKCVSVVIKDAVKYLGSNSIDDFRTKLSEPQRRYSFK